MNPKGEEIIIKGEKTTDITGKTIKIKDIKIQESNGVVVISSKNKKNLDEFVKNLLKECLQENKYQFHKKDNNGIINDFSMQVFNFCREKYGLTYEFDTGLMTRTFSYKNIDIYFNVNSGKGHDDYVLNIWCSAPGIIKDMLETIKQKQNTKPQIYTHIQNSWSKQKSQISKTIDTVFLPENVKENLLKDINMFIQDRENYIKFGLKYQRGYLFYGVPGSGKTSTIKAISQHLSLDVYLINLTEIDSCESLKSLMSDINQDRFHAIVFEDIDCVGLQYRNQMENKVNEEKEKNPISLDTILNIIDGVQESSNRLVFMTTNYIEKLDPALIRDGRVDMRIQFSLCDEFQLKQIYKMIFEEDLPQIKFKINTFTTSQIINLCLQNKHNKQRFLELIQ